MYRNQIHFERAQAIAADLAILRRQGVEPVAEFFGLSERYVSGELTIEQFEAAVECMRRGLATPEFTRRVT
jgi:hypothetical protein